MKKIITFALIVLAIPCFAQEESGSLWNNGAKNPLADRIARNIGDVLTVIVSEVSSASTTAATQGSKADKNAIDAGIGPILKNLIPTLGTSTSSNSSGSGSTSRSGKLTARLTVTVKKVMPNGNLVIEGSRFIQTNKETQKMVIEGIVRPDDIKSDNTVLSEDVAEASIKYDGKGTVGDRQRQGIISRLLNWLF